MKGTISVNIYTKINFRKIYKDYYGSIPKDANGRTYEIHHIDGNRNNNDITNLIAVSIQEHYDIHYSQEDWGACFKIAKRLELSPTEKSDLAKKSNIERIKNGTHHFLGPETNYKYCRERVSNGTHHFLGGEIQKKRVKNGTHNLLGQNNPTHKRIADGTHHLLGSAHNLNRLANGTHPSQIMKTCEYCNKTVNAMLFGRLHGNRCKDKTTK